MANIVPTSTYKLATAPSFGDIVLHFLFEKPAVPPAWHAWIGFVREVVIFAVLDIIAFFTNAFNSGRQLTGADFIAIGLQVAYIIVRAVINNPLSPLFIAAANSGVSTVEHVIAQSGGVLPDVGGLPDAPQPPYQMQPPADRPPRR